MVGQRGVYAILAGLRADILQGCLVGFILDVFFVDEFCEEVLAAWEARVVAWGCAVVVGDVVGDYVFEAADGGVFELCKVCAEAVVEFDAADEVFGLVIWSGVPGRKLVG